MKKVSRRPPASPPSLQTLLGRRVKQVLRLQEDGAGETILRLADGRDRYLHWEDLRRRPLPEGVEPETAWALIQWHRIGQLRTLPFQAPDGSPVRLVLTDPLRAALRRIDLGGPLRESGLPAADDPAGVGFLRRAVVEEAIASSRIEGVRTTRAEARALIRSGRSPATREERMILNNFRVLEWMEDHLEEALTPERILEAHALITEGTLEDPEDCGRLRSGPVHVEDPAWARVVHQPPPASELEDRLQLLCDFANEPEDDADYLHPLVRAILLHYQLALDHPFVDGNGRTARWLFLWSVARRPEYPWIRFLRISRRIEASRRDYYRSFELAATDAWDATYFVRHQVTLLEREMKSFAGFLQERRDRDRRLLDELRLRTGLHPRQLQLVDHALRHRDAVFTQAGHARYHGISRPTAARDLKGLMELGLLSRKRTAAGFVYKAAGRLRSLARQRAPD